jgi:two-component system NarL family sensor kinase
MKQYLTLCLCWFFLPVLTAQNIDSLQKVILSSPQDTHLVMTYRQLVRAYYQADQNQEMLQTAEKGLELSRALQFEKGIDLFIYYKASALDILGRAEESIPLFEEGLQLAQKRGNLSGIADYHVNIGVAFQGMGEQDKALEHFLTAYDQYTRSGKKENLSKILNNIGVIYRSQKKYDRAEEIYLTSLRIKEELKDSIGIAASFQNLSALYSATNQESKAIEYQQKAENLYTLFNKLDDVAGCNSLLGQIYFNFNKLPEAKAALQKALKLYGNEPSIEYGPSTLFLLGKIALQEKEPALGEKYLQQAAQLARKTHQNETLINILSHLANAENQLGKDAAAFKTLQEAFVLKDTLTEQNRLMLMEEMQAKFEVSQKNNELKINQLSLQQRTQERNWFVLAATLLAVLVFLVFFGLKARIKTNKKLAAQASAIQEQMILQLEQENKLTALNAMIGGQEKERIRIANDLHDGLGGLLSSVKSHFNALQRPQRSDEIFLKTNQLIDDACGEVRRIAHNMMPRSLAISGLSGALEDLCSQLNKQGLECELEMIGLENHPLSPEQNTSIYRIIQELSNNVVKHAQAKHLLLQLLATENTLSILVEDDGIGFDTAQALQQKGLGLSSIESRVQYLKGEIDWDAVPGQGVSVSIQLPI